MEQQRTAVIEGYNQFLGKIFFWMFAGLAVTAGVSYAAASSYTFMYTLMTNPFLLFAIVIGEFAMVGFLSARIMKLSTGASIGLFMGYSALNGLMLSSILLAFTGESIAVAFASAAGVFAVMGIYGHVTKTDLSVYRTFFMVAIVGIIIASVLNFFIASSGLSYFISLIGVVVFAGLTAYDMQKMKKYYAISQQGRAPEGNLVIHGALTLYLDFINLFLFLIRLTGNRR